MTEYMPVVLTPDQLRYLYATLLGFEKALRWVDHLLENGEEVGILYYRRMQLDISQRQHGREIVAQALQELASFVQLLGITPKEEFLDQIIVAEMSVSWADLVDGRSDRLKGYGEVKPETAAVIDPILDRLSKMAFELSQLLT